MIDRLRFRPTRRGLHTLTETTVRTLDATVNTPFMTSAAVEKRSLTLIAWESLVLGAATLAAVVIPIRIVLAPSEQPLSLFMDAALTALFGVDVVLRARQRRGAGRSRAWNRWWLAVDVLSALSLA
jgi:hypothetical protein